MKTAPCRQTSPIADVADIPLTDLDVDVAEFSMLFSDLSSAKSKQLECARWLGLYLASLNKPGTKSLYEQARRMMKQALQSLYMKAYACNPLYSSEQAREHARAEVACAMTKVDDVLRAMSRRASSTSSQTSSPSRHGRLAAAASLEA